MPIPPDFHADKFAYVQRWTMRDCLALYLPSFFARTRARAAAKQRAISAASEELAARLQELIAQRLQISREPVRELEHIVAELRALGHPLELDEDNRCWTIYADQPCRNLAVWVHWHDAEHVRVTQTEVLWQRM